MRTAPASITVAALTGLLVAGSLVAGCAGAHEDVTSDASELQVRPRVASGSELDSQFVDPAKKYVSFRSIARLAELGALPGPLRELADRVDGSVATGPADGTMTIEELVMLEHTSSVFPEERERLRQLWPLFEVGSEVLSLAPADPKLVEKASETFWPARLDRVRGVPIRTLASNLQPIASRLELSIDSDGDRATVSLDDLANATPEHLAAFRPDEIERLPQITEAAHAFAVQGLGNGEYILDVPEPRSTKTSFDVGPVRLVAEETLQILEFKTGPIDSINAARIVLRHAYAAQWETLPDVSLNVIDIAAGSERASPFGSGGLVLEVWKNGTRVAHRRVDHAPVSSDRTFYGHANPTSRGRALRRNASAELPSAIASFELEAGTPGFPRDVPNVRLRPGTYGARSDEAVLEVFQDNVLFLREPDGARWRFSFGRLPNGSGQFRARTAYGAATFNAETSRLSYTRLSDLSIDLTDVYLQ